MKYIPTLKQFAPLDRYWLHLAVSLAILSAILLPLNLLVIQPLHHDEALYATWALEIASGDDPWLTNTPIDKPPLFLYTVAGVIHLLGATATNTRIPSLLATGLIVLFTFGIGHKLYGKEVGLLAAWLVALSPFSLLFAPTAFTDPMLVALMLAGCLAAIHNRAGWAGICLGLAVTTKQQGIFFIPLPIALLIANNKWSTVDNTHQSSDIVPSVTVILHSVSYFTHHASRITHNLLHTTGPLFLTLFLTLLPTLIWDISRSQPSSFFEQSFNNYGGLSIDIGGFNQRWRGFIDLLYYGTASPLLNTIFLIGYPILLIYGGWLMTHRWRRSIRWVGWRLRMIQADWLLFLFILAFLFLHATLSFQIWDRYLLGLIPLLALLLAHMLLLPWLILKTYFSKYLALSPSLNFIIGLSLAVFLAINLTNPVQDAINARYPLGSNSHALRGIEQITAYLQGNIGANHTLYHRWLGTHWRFHLWNYPYDLQYWDSPSKLAAKAQPGQLIAYPTWQSDTELRLALFKTNLTLQELTRAYTPGGKPSIILYQIEVGP